MDKSLLKNIIIGVVIVIGVLFLYWKFDYSKNSKKIGELKAEYDKLNTQVNEARKVAARMQEYIEKLKILERKLAVANKMLPDSQKFEKIIDSITILANRNNIKIKTLKPQSISTGEEYATVPFDVSVLAQYHSFALFLNDLGKQNRIYRVSNVVITPIGGSKEGDFNISAKFSLSTYFKGSGTVSNNSKGGKNGKKK